VISRATELDDVAVVRAELGARPDPHPVGQADHLERTRAIRQATDVAPFLQTGDQPMDPGLRLQPKGRPHFLERGWHAVIPEITVNEPKQLVLPLSEHLTPPFSRRTVEFSGD